MPTPPIEKVRKLLALALNNPNIEEAMAAALMAAQLIEKNNFTVGGETVTIPHKNWEAPEEDVIGDILKAAGKASGYAVPEQEQWQGAPAGPAGMKAHIPDTDLDDDLFRNRVIFAWRSIRQQRAVLEREIKEYEKATGRKYPRL